jgi:hypothetical protein
MQLANLNNGDVLSPQYNPTEIEEEVRVNYTDLDLLGMSHKPQQYKNTDNHRFQFSLRFDGLAIRQAHGSPGIPVHGANLNNARRYLLSLCYAPRGAQDILGGQPPRVLFFWPQLISLQAKLRRLRFRHSHFASSTGGTGRFDVDVEIHEIRDVRLVSEDVFANGTIRSP